MPTPEEGGPNLVFNAESNVEARLDQMNQAYKKVQEKRMKAVFARMPPEQLKELQLAKLFKLANMIHQTRFKDLVANLLLGRARTFTNSAVQ